MDLLELSGQFRGAALVARAQVEVEQALECGRMPWRTLQDVLEEVRGLLRKPVAREEVHIGQRLRDIALRLLIKPFLGVPDWSRRLGCLDEHCFRGALFRRAFVPQRHFLHRLRLTLCHRLGRGSLAARSELFEARDQTLVALVALDHLLHQVFGARLISRGGVGVH